MEMETAMIKYVTAYLNEHNQEYLQTLNVELPVIDTIPSITFMEALEFIKGKSGKNKYDLEPEDEVLLYEYAKEKWNSEFIFITHFPALKRLCIKL